MSSPHDHPFDPRKNLEQLRFFWQQRDTILANPRLSACRSDWTMFAAYLAGTLFPELGALLSGWQSRLLTSECPECKGPLLVARAVAFPDTSAWWGFCTECPKLVIDAGQGTPWVREAGLLPGSQGGAAAWRREKSGLTGKHPTIPGIKTAVGVSFAALEGLLRGQHVTTSIYCHEDMQDYAYDELSGELTDFDGTVRLVYDATTGETRDASGQLVTIRENERLDRVLLQGREPWFERSKVDECHVWLAAGVEHLPIRYKETADGLRRWKDCHCLRVNGPVPVDVLLLIAENWLPPVVLSTPAMRC